VRDGVIKEQYVSVNFLFLTIENEAFTHAFI
jgi:hypothetical protein